MEQVTSLRAWWMRLADAFGAFVATPTPVKLAVMMTFFLPSQAAADLVLWITARESGDLRMDVMDGALLHGVLVVAFSAVLSWVAVRRQWTSRAPLYVAVGLYSTSMVHLIHVLGTWTTPFVVIIPVIAFVCGVVFGPAIGWFSLMGSFAMSLGVEVVRWTGALDYAPAVRSGAMEGDPSVWWIAFALIPLGAFVLSAFAMTMSVVAVVELQQHRLDRQAETLQRSQELIGRYVPSQVLTRVLQSGDIGHERRKISVYFSDIVGFTELVDRLEPEDLSRVLNDYFARVTIIAQKYDGTVDELIGDAVLILFGAPTSTDPRDEALRAVRMAVDIQRGIVELNESWERAGIDAVLRVRMAVDTGVVTVGNFGSSGRTKYAALGRAVNVAARLQASAEPDALLISHATWLLVRDTIAYARVGELDLKGVHHPVRTYRVDGMVP